MKDESFDHVPAIARPIPEPKLPDINLSLTDRLHHIYKDKSAKSKDAQQRAFFSSLTIDQYEECGDLLLNEFQELVDRLKQARQQKRKAARAMEDEITKREEWVRKRVVSLDQDLGRLKKGATDVVRGKIK